KGTGSDVTPPELVMSYRVGVTKGHVTLQFFDAGDQKSPLFVGPAITPDQFFQLIIVKRTSTPVSSSNSADPYPAACDTSDLGTIADHGMAGHSSGFPSGGGDITISKIAPAGESANTKSLKFLDSLKGGLPKAYDVTISVREVHTDGSFGDWVSVPA